MNTARQVLLNDNSTKRTKNRINENGPWFHLGREMPVICFGTTIVKARLLHSVSTDWVGWVPTAEITIHI